MNWSADVKRLLTNAGSGMMRPTAYDTAWFARLAALNEPLTDEALSWLRATQHADGSWGATAPYYAYDRIISTLSVMTALAYLEHEEDVPRIERAHDGLTQALQYASVYPTWETAAFEMLAPMLLKEAMRLGTGSFHGEALQRMIALRAKKLAALNGNKIDHTVPVSFSAEMAGRNLHLLDLDRLQAVDGSVAYSPSATAYFYLYGRRDPKAQAYLRKIARQYNGKMPNVYPFAVFERAWILWNLVLTDALDGELMAHSRPVLDALEAAWEPGKGVSYQDDYIPDGDDTSFTYETLRRYGRSPDFDAVMYHYVGEHFRCNILEANISISTNAHALGALRAAGKPFSAEPVQSVIAYLQQTKTKDGYWLDKWHVSPYYATGHAIISAAGYVDDLVETAVDWLHASQNADGSWGYYLPTAEETAYAIQALVMWHRYGGVIDQDAVKRGAAWLSDHCHDPDPPLWIGKCLYAPTLVIESAVLSAMKLAEQL